MPSGSRTIWTQRGTSSGATRAGGAGVGSRSGGAAGPASPTPSSGFAASSSVCRDIDSDDTVRSITSILFIGDVVGRAGRRVIRELLPDLREELATDFVVINGENAAGGLGITPKEADELLRAGADAITLGNHTYRHREIWPYLEEERRIVRPYNYLRAQPGRGTTIVERDGVSLGIINLSGMVHLQAGAPPLVAVDEALREVAGADQILVDMHAEVTSEKVALGWHLDGKVTAVVGTHTHIPTADARVLPGGTAYITDVGMTGARGGVIGMKKEQSIAVMRTHMPMRYEPSEVDPWINAVLIRTSAPRRADEITQILRPLQSGP
jgi:metallophosphoesterase (TIGR00282 family)